MGARLLARELLRDFNVRRCPGCQRLKHRDEYHRSKRGSGIESPCKTCKSARAKTKEILDQKRRRKYQVRYGITEDERQAMVDAQGGVCAICKGLPGSKGLHIDHCHETGRVRGMLCYSCNTLLGNAHDNPDILLAAISYLEKL